MTRTALELIGQSGLGYSFDPLTEDGKEHRFSVSAKLLVYVTTGLFTQNLFLVIDVFAFQTRGDENQLLAFRGPPIRWANRPG